MRLQHLLAEPGADLADGLIFLGVGVTTGEEERSVDVRALAFAVVPPNDNEVEGIANTSKVVFLQLYVVFIRQ